VVGTYLHGPVLARNPVLADVVLAWALGADGADGAVGSVVGSEAMGWSSAEEGTGADEAASELRDERLGGDGSEGARLGRRRGGGRRRRRAQAG
jgi:hypothetical protein